MTVDEVLTVVNVALGSAPVSNCSPGDANGDGQITVDEILTAVDFALNGCPAPVETPAATMTPTPEVTRTPICGDMVVDAPAGEECDDGGICIGGSNAGIRCASESECPGDGVCDGGPKMLVACSVQEDCPNGRCIRCKPFGGDGCAANCTTETDINFDLVPGLAEGSSIEAGTSGAVLNGETLTVPLPLTGTPRLTIGHKRNGQITAVIKAASVNLPQIDVHTSCLCVRAVPYKTCGGTLFERDGTLSASCTDGFAASPVTCPAQKPCAFIYGDGNSAAGSIGCDSLTPVNVDWQQDCNAVVGGDPASPVISLSGTGPPGSALMFQTLALGIQMGACIPSFCTDADPAAARGTPLPLVSTTSAATATVHNANDFSGFDVGPFSVAGTPFSCDALEASPPTVAGVNLASASTACSQPTVLDVVVTTQLVGQ